MPITREGVLEALGRRGRPPASVKALLRELGAGRHEQQALRRVLQGLQREGKVERADGGFRLRRADGLLEGRYEAAGGGEAGARVFDEGGVPWRVPAYADAEPGDRVLLRPLGDPQQRRGEVVHVLAAARRTTWIGILSRERHGGVVTPYRDDAHWGIRIAAADLAAARDGDVVVVAPQRRSGRREEPGGRVIEVLGTPGEPAADFRAVVWRRRLPVEFPAPVTAEAEALPREPAAEEIARRVDLRARPFVTIDPSTARDHDDAVCVEPLEGGATRLWVAIADVAHMVREGSAIDAEALRRGTSVYFPDRAIPMLPEVLSGDLCSLRPGVDRLAMTVELELGRDGEVRKRSFYPSVIRSRARLAYEEAAACMEGRGEGGPRDPELVAQLRALAALARTLMERRFAAGSIDFDLPTAEIVMGDGGHPVDIVEAPRTIAHRAIEEAMLAANRAVAEALDAARAPAIYRVHEPPAPGDVRALRDLLAAFGLLASREDDAISPREIARAVQRVAGRPEERLVNLVALRSMRQARYHEADRGHFALAFESYTHFTSPIRRYADLVVHRALKDLLAGDAAAQRRAQARAPVVAGVATRVSWRERVAMEAEREMVDLKKCAFMAPRVGEEFAGTLTGVAKHGFYVTLDDFFVEGLVHVSTLDDYVTLDERAYALVARRSRERFRLGDRFRVRVENVDRVKAWINFSVLERLRG